MYQSINLPLCREIQEKYGGWDSLRESCRALGCDGVEGIWTGEEIPADFPSDLLVGYHLTFFPDWLDFYLNDHEAVLRKFGSREMARTIFGGEGPESILNTFRTDLARARKLGAKYVVFHVSDVSLEESYTYRWLHSDEQVIDAAVEIINTLLDGMEPEFDFLVENQWWPGFTFTDPRQTKRLLDGISYPRKGIMLDTGHLMNTNMSISDQEQGIAYIRAQLEDHGCLCDMIRGVHLHQSTSGVYVRSHTGMVPEEMPGNYAERFSASYGHIKRIDPHLPWTEPEIADLIQQIRPAYLTHELSAPDGKDRFEAVRCQMATMRKGQRIS